MLMTTSSLKLACPVAAAARARVAGSGHSKHNCMQIDFRSLGQQYLGKALLCADIALTACTRSVIMYCSSLEMHLPKNSLPQTPPHMLTACQKGSVQEPEQAPWPWPCLHAFS